MEEKRPPYQSLLNFYNNFHTISNKYYERCEKDLKSYIETFINSKLNADILFDNIDNHKLVKKLKEQVQNQQEQIYKLNKSIGTEIDYLESIDYLDSEIKKENQALHRRINKLTYDIKQLRNDLNRIRTNTNHNDIFNFRNSSFNKIPPLPKSNICKDNDDNQLNKEMGMAIPIIAIATGLYGNDTNIKLEDYLKKNNECKSDINDKIDSEHDPKQDIVLTDEELIELAGYLQKLNSINDIIEFEKIDSNKVIRFKNNYKFKILYNCIGPLKELQNMTGLKSLKQDIFKHICYYSNNLHRDEDLNHIVITGPPGVGKTCVSKILGKLYLEMGFLTKDTFNSYKRSDLVGRYLGETAQKTQKAINESLGGVMLIDEVYELGNSGKSSEDIYSKECLDTLNRNLSENGNKFLCIIAGYEDSIERDIMRQNQGLKRRFGTKFNIEKYTQDELFEIFKSKLKDWSLENEEYAKNKFKKFDKNIFKFYAADAEVLFKLIRYEYGVRITKSINEPDRIIKNIDIDAAYKNMKALREDKDDIIPIGMFI